MFLDASALCAVLLDEPEQAEFRLKITMASRATTSPVAVWETVRAMVRERSADVASALDVVERLLDAGQVAIAPIGPDEQALAIGAFDRFGKGRHPAALNMGDCFAYACARSLGMPLLYKGEDFARTDIERA